MNNDWILDVIGDLKTFATMNGLDHLAAALDDTCEVARTELGVAGFLTGIENAPAAGNDYRVAERRN